MTKYTWSQTAATNANADGSINWAEGMAPGAVNNSARAQMAASAKERDDHAGVMPDNAVITTGGTSTAYTVTSNQVLSTLVNGFTITFRPHATCGATPTLNVDALGAKPLRVTTAVELAAGDLVAGREYTATYFQPTDEWLIRAAPMKLADDSVDSQHIVDGAIDTAHIADDQVTFPKIQNITTARLLGRTTASDGDIEQLTVSSDLTLAAGVLGIAVPSDLVHIETQTASASANLSFTTLSADYASFIFEIDDLRPATDDVDFWMRVRPTAGAFQTSGYQSLAIVGVPSAAAGAHTETSAILLSSSQAGAGDGVGNDANYGVHGRVRIKVAGTGRHFVTGETAHLTSGGVISNVKISGLYDTNGSIDAVQFRFSSGDITSGTIRCYGLKA